MQKLRKKKWISVEGSLNQSTVGKSRRKVHVPNLKYHFLQKLTNRLARNLNEPFEKNLFLHHINFSRLTFAANFSLIGLVIRPRERKRKINDLFLETNEQIGLKFELSTLKTLIMYSENFSKISLVVGLQLAFEINIYDLHTTTPRLHNT